MIGERLGIASAAQERTRRFAERHPALARFFLGRGPDYAAQPKLIIADPAYRGMPKIADIMAAQGLPELPAVIEVPPLKVEMKLDERGNKRVRLNQSYASAITQIVCQVWGVDHARLMSPERTRRVSFPRMAAWLLIRNRMRAEGKSISYPEIGKYFRRDHTTVMSGVEKAEWLMDADPEWRANFDAASALLDEAANGSRGPA